MGMLLNSKDSLILARISKKKPDASVTRSDEAKWDRVPTKIKMDEILSVDFQANSPYTPDKPGKEEK